MEASGNAKQCPDIERIEDRREPNPDMDAIYFLSPQPHIVECLLADFDRRRYRKAYLLWTGVLHPELERRLSGARPQIACRKLLPFYEFPRTYTDSTVFETLLVDYYPRESHVATFRDPWSFPVLYHPDCNDLVAKHLKDLAQKVCVDYHFFPIAQL